jgi:hypothetical protein
MLNDQQDTSNKALHNDKEEKANNKISAAFETSLRFR